jgi:hypothetical protein
MKIGGSRNKAVHLFRAQTGARKESANRKSCVMTPASGRRPISGKQTRHRQQARHAQQIASSNASWLCILFPANKLAGVLMDRRREYGLSPLAPTTNTQLKQTGFFTRPIGVIKRKSGVIRDLIRDVEAMRSGRGLATKDGASCRHNRPRKCKRFRTIQINIDQAARGRPHLNANVLLTPVEVLINVGVVDFEVLPTRASRRLLVTIFDRDRIPSATDIFACGLPN